MTNTIDVLNPAHAETWFSRNSDAILVAVITTAVIAAGALIWQILVTPKINSWQEKRVAKQRRKELVSSLFKNSIGAGIDVRYGKFMHITLPNNTSKPVTVREVALLTDEGGKLIMSHHSDDFLVQNTAVMTDTGTQIMPHSEATWMWYQRSGGTPLSIKRYSVTFEYTLGDGDIEVAKEISPSSHEEDVIMAYHFLFPDVEQETI